MLATNTASECSFSALCWNKKSMKLHEPGWLNHTMLLVHKDHLDSLDELEIAHEFVLSSEHRLKLLGAACGSPDIVFILTSRMLQAQYNIHIYIIRVCA